MELGSAAPEPLWAGRLARTPFAAVLAKGAPLIVSQGAPPRVVFATPAALAAFGAADDAALGEAVFASDNNGSRRLARLAGEMPEGAPPRLEALRFSGARRPMSAYWLCARLKRDDEAFFIVADAAASKEGGEADSLRASVRFVWRLDGDERFGPADPALADALGGQAPREGETLDALCARAGLGAAWAQAVAGRRSFSRLKVLWTETGGERARVAWVSGAPLMAAAETYQGFRGFGLVTAERVALASAPKSAPRPALVKPVAGDAAALIGLLQRQHAPLPGAAGATNAPALAIIAALAALLQPKTGSVEPKPSPRPQPQPQPGPEPAGGGAEIVVLRPNAHPPQDAAARDGEMVPLTSQERDAFKEIARALGANVRSARPGVEPPDAEPASPPAEPAPEPKSGPDAGDLVAMLDNLPIAALVVRGSETLFANKTLLSLAGFADLDDFRARDGLKTIFRGRDPKTLAPGGVVTGVPLEVSGDRILTVDAQVRRTVWGGEGADLIAMRRSLEAEHQAAIRAVERETAMHAARARDFAVALDAARVGMVRLDRSGRILGMNPGAETMFGSDQKEAAGETFLSLLAPASHASASAAFEKLAQAQAGPIERLEATARAHDGRTFPARLDFGRLANQPEPDFFMLATDRGGADVGVAEAEAAREEAEKASLAKTDLLSRVSHEMRTPLHAIMGFAEVILEERFGPIGSERYRDYIRDIHASGRHVLSLANDLLDLTKIELGKMDLQFTLLDVNSVIRECVTLMQPQAARERIIMRLSLYDRLPSVTADERSLRQIMLNLMANAVKYNEPGGQVIVSTALDDAGAVVVRVRDTGVGMNESELAIALEPFRRAPGAKLIEGSGLGLPLTKALVEANHGEFAIKSRKDQGTLVEIAFPVQQAAQ